MDIFLIFQGLLLSMGCLLNLSFGVVIFFNPLESRVTSYLIGQQSMIDAFLCFINLLHNHINHYENVNFFIYNTFVCHIWTSLWTYYHVVQMSIENLICIAIDRYMAVVKATTYKEKQRCILIFSNIYIWILSFSVSFPGTLEMIMVNKSCQPIAVINSTHINALLLAYSTIYFFLSYVLPTLFFIYVYGQIIRIMKNMKSTGSDNSMKNRFTLSAIIITCFFVILYAYDTVYYVLGKLHLVGSVNSVPLQKVRTFLVTMNTFVHPIVCLCLMKNIRRRYIKFYGNLFRCSLKMKRQTRKIDVMPKCIP